VLPRPLAGFLGGQEKGEGGREKKGKVREARGGGWDPTKFGRNRRPWHPAYKNCDTTIAKSLLLGLA